MTWNDFYNYVRDGFDVLYAEGGRMMSVGLHCRLIGRPGRLARRIDIARHWLKNHPHG